MTEKGRSLQFVPLTQNLIRSCEEFNKRLHQAGTDLHFACPANRDRGESPPVPMEVDRFVGVDSDGQVHGAYLLRWQFLWLRGQQFFGASGGYPISEGVIDKRFTMVGVIVLRDAIKRCSDLYFLGAGGRGGNVFRVAQHYGWQIADVPFLFRVVNGARFLSNLPQMQGSPGRRLLGRIGRGTGLAQIATELLTAGSAIRNRGSSSLRLSLDVTVEEAANLAGAADEVWLRVKSQYLFCVVRDGAHVESSFPLGRTDLHRLVVRHKGSVVGWAVVMTESLLRLRAYLGDLIPGLIVDTFGDTAYITDIVRAATAYLAAQGVDVVITNSSHGSWVDGYKRSGFINWRSQFPLLVSQSLGHRIGDLPIVMQQAHFTRGDGDGVHYLH